MTPELARMLMDRAQQATPLRDSVERVRTPMAPEPAIPKPSKSTVSPMDPYTLSLLGGLMDSGSTYTFLKRKTGKEDNALVAGLAKKSPELLTALGAAANLAVPLIWKQVAKKFPKAGKALAANQGALQFGYGALNMQNTLTPRRSAGGEGRKSSERYTDALLRDQRMQGGQ